MATGSIVRRREAARREAGPAYVARLNEIVRAATILFREKGYEATTLNDVAQTLGTNRASLYYYVGSKEDLLHDAIRDVILGNINEAERLCELDIPAPDKLRSFIRAVVLSYEANYPQVFVYIERDITKDSTRDSEWAKEMKAQTRRIESLVLELLKQGVAEGSFRSDLNIELVAKSLWGMLNWTYRWYKPGAYAAAEVFDTFSTLFLEGNTNPRGSQARQAG